MNSSINPHPSADQNITSTANPPLNTTNIVVIVINEKVTPLNGNLIQSNAHSLNSSVCINATPPITCNQSSQEDVLLPPFGAPHDNREKIEPLPLVVDLKKLMGKISSTSSHFTKNSPIVHHLPWNEPSLHPKPPLFATPNRNLTTTPAIGSCKHGEPIRLVSNSNTTELNSQLTLKSSEPAKHSLELTSSSLKPQSELVLSSDPYSNPSTTIQGHRQQCSYE